MGLFDSLLGAPAAAAASTLFDSNNAYYQAPAPVAAPQPWVPQPRVTQQATLKSKQAPAEPKRKPQPAPVQPATKPIKPAKKAAEAAERPATEPTNPAKKVAAAKQPAEAPAAKKRKLAASDAPPQHITLAPQQKEQKQKNFGPGSASAKQASAGSKLHSTSSAVKAVATPINVEGEEGEKGTSAASAATDKPKAEEPAKQKVCLSHSPSLSLSLSLSLSSV